MRRQDSILTGLAATIVASACVYAVNPTVPVYDTVARAWRWHDTGGLTIHWYGRSFVAVLSGLAVFVVSRVLLREPKVAAEPPLWLPGVITAVTLAVLAVAMVHLVSVEIRAWM